MARRLGIAPALLAILLVGCGDQRPGPGAAAAPRDVVVPQVDRTPPTATIRAAGVTAVSPSSSRDVPRTVTVPTGRFRATAVAVDRDGGTGRIRLSFVYAVRCGAQVRHVTEHRPPAQIARVRLAPGTAAPARRERTETLRFRVGPGCTARGEVFAEAGNAHGLDAISRHIGVSYARRLTDPGGTSESNRGG